MCPHDLVGDREAKANAARMASPDLVRSIERLEDVWHISGRDTAAVVLDGHDRMAADAPHGDGDLRGCRRVGDGISREVENRPAEMQRASKDNERFTEV